jgi:hypothetical protein
MKREARLLLDKACDSLILSVEFFNRPHDRGRVASSLILMDHAFEMLLKSAILHRNGRIREKRAKQTIGFDACVRRALSDATVKFVTEEQALLLQALNGLRDAAQHHLLEVSEAQLYMQAQAGITLFRDLMMSVFGRNLTESMPSRVLPVSTTPPITLATLFETEIAEIKKLLGPGKRRKIEAEARLRPLAILDSAISGEKDQPTSTDLRAIGSQLSKGIGWEDVFRGASAIELTASGFGPSLSLRFTKKEGIPIQVVQEGTPGASVVAIKRVNELDYYSVGARALAEKVGLSTNKALAVVDYLGLRRDPECFKEIRIGKTVFKRYSPKAIDRIQQCLKVETANAIWARRGGRNRTATGLRS